MWIIEIEGHECWGVSENHISG